jgi:hypothetical protein
MRKINKEAYDFEPERYELRRGIEPEAPDCPYGNRYEWIGFDKTASEYVRFTKSVFKLLMKNYG